MGYLKSRRLVENYVRDKGIEVLQFHNTTTFAPFIRSKLRKKSIITLHGTITGFYRDMRSWKFPFGWLFEEVALNSAKLVTTITMAHMGDFWIRRPVKLIRNGVDLKRFNPKKFSRRQLRKKYGFNEFTVLFLSKMMKNKGGEYFVKAAEQLPKFQFVLAGDGPDRGRVETIAPKNVKFMGRVSEAEKLKLYAAADVFVLPTISEGFPLVILEAMAMGLPIISTTIRGVREIMKGRGSAILLEPKDVNGLVGALEELAGDKKLKTKMGQSGRRNVEKEFSWDNIAKEYEQTFERVIRTTQINVL
jgi:glycosyltransferase involved in cell wall biosynthesis